VEDKFNMPVARLGWVGAGLCALIPMAPRCV
jgi:hypothetical protein